MFRFWDCAVPGCLNAAAVDVGGCERCRQMYCATHVTASIHTCERKPLDDDAWEAAQTEELVKLSAKTSHAALLKRAKELSGGLECRIDDRDPLGSQLMGSMHVHLQIIFENGTTWLARILRETFTSFSDELSNQILLNECATLRWLESVDVPTPRLYDYGLRGDENNKVGIAYMLIDKLPGRPYNPYVASEEQKSKVLEQWAGILCALGKHSFDSVGSLHFDSTGTIKVGPIAGDRTGTLPRIGPFDHARKLYHSWASSYLELISDGQLFSSFSVDAWLMFKFLAEKSSEGPWFERWQELNTGPFFLKHTDDKGDHILVDDDFQITGVIDWTFARVVPAYEAFGPSLVSASTNDIFHGKVGLSEDDKVLSNALDFQGAPFNYFESDMVRRFLFGIGMGLDLSKKEALEVFRCIVSTFEDAMPNFEDWRNEAISKWANNTQLIKLRETAGIDTSNHP